MGSIVASIRYHSLSYLCGCALASFFNSDAGKGSATETPPVCACTVDVASVVGRGALRAGADGLNEAVENNPVGEDVQEIRVVTPPEVINSEPVSSTNNQSFKKLKSDKVVEYHTQASSSSYGLDQSIVAATPSASQDIKFDEEIVTAKDPNANEYDGLGKMGTMTAIAIALHNFPEV